MNFTALDYYRAATERMQQALTIYASGKSYGLAMYSGGLAVECLLRAFRWRIDPSFDGRHDLEDLLKTSALLNVHESWLRQKGATEDEIFDHNLNLRGAMAQVKLLWHNNLRFASEDRLRKHLLQIGRLRGIRGNALKKNALDLLTAAQTLVNRGIAVWTSGRK